MESTILLSGTAKWCFMFSILYNRIRFASPCSILSVLNPRILWEQVEVSWQHATSTGAVLCFLRRAHARYELHPLVLSPPQPHHSSLFLPVPLMWDSLPHKQLSLLLFLYWIIEWLRLEGTLKIIQFQPSAMGRAATHQIRLPRAPSNLQTQQQLFPYIFAPRINEANICKMTHFIKSYIQHQWTRLLKILTVKELIIINPSKALKALRCFNFFAIISYK